MKQQPYFVTFLALGQIKRGVDLGGALLTERRELESDGLSQAVTCFQFQLRRLRWNLVEVSEDEEQKFDLRAEDLGRTCSLFRDTVKLQNSVVKRK